MLEATRHERLLTALLRAQEQFALEIKPTCAPNSSASPMNWVSPPASPWAALAGRTYCIITPAGEVQPCPYLPLPVGNVHETPFLTWRDADVLQTPRAGHLEGTCGSCRWGARCFGCRAPSRPLEACSRKIPGARRAWSGLVSTPLFPIFLNLQDQPCVVIGGGAIAARKARALLDAGASSPSFSRTRAGDDAALAFLHVIAGSPPGDLAGHRLAFAATDDPEVNSAVYANAEAAGIFVNTADNPEHCRFLVPASFDCGPIGVAVSTGGASPRSRGCAELEAALRLRPTVPSRTYSAACGRGRRHAAAHHDRAARWPAVLDSDVLTLLEHGKAVEAKREARRILGLEMVE